MNDGAAGVQYVAQAPPLRAVGIIVVLKGFVDDSGSSDGNVFVLAGFLAQDEQWENFSDEWKEICGQDPQTPDFKMAKAYRLKEYRWTEEQRDRRINELVALILKRAKYRVDAVLAWPNYEQIVKGNLQREIDSPYFTLFYHVILTTAVLMNKAGLEGTVDWVFDDQGKTGNECVGWYSKIKELAPPEIKCRLGSAPIFRHDTDILPLKAADMLAWQIRRHLNEEQPRQIAHNDILDSLLTLHGVSCHIHGEDLEKLVPAINEKPMLQAHVQYFLDDQGESYTLASS